MLVLYPELKPYQRHSLKVSELHELYIDEAGNPDGIPVLFVHGGPGGGCDGSSRRFYDPALYRIVTFDQRGCGRSTPHGELSDNTTQDLIADMEAIRVHLGIDSWVLFGGSWGSTLSLLYAQHYPQRVMALVLRGIFLCRQCDFDWLYKDGANRIFPDYWEEFIKPIPQSEWGDLAQAYNSRLLGDDELLRMGVAKAWSAWEGNCSKLRPSPTALAKFTKPHNALALARIETHYFVNKGFIDENYILNNMQSIKDIPGRIVHGRYDMVCPLDNALRLHQQWPNSELVIVRDAGHSASEPGTVDALIRVVADIAKQLKSAS
ncbi:MAG TPA: prolyl aminopeptidase [Gammaproteobacteria bacterium]|nr:prolyl aminopeptidase [Gammaproteobacteria bacterium]HAT28058.1 prolyl aminopeptidase [Gammaproteobacteria bacterium]|tara:strand:- start:5320 stop:6279 length:960 start_codon:yes stop_codon:yes gene_type:complete